eukprot:TRINITY_DN8299_c0_g1_i4.p1 TRINITY_DN8299_c0_g1~~TRINITY_DN8299_c0_g1_i4.p1  ORF type:complete len:789 (+),score=177.37 TRINITY_DN8299_c0_g1_i4:297-2369(+)
MLIGVVPADLKRLVSTSTLDEGYMCGRIGGRHVASSYVPNSSKEVHQALLEFAEHTSNDRWPSDHCDPAARNQPKDGATLFSSTSSVIATAVCLDHPPVRFKIQRYGTRTQAGVGLAEWLASQLVSGSPGGAVFLKSSNGSMKVFFPRMLQEQGAAYYVHGTGSCCSEKESAPGTASSEQVPLPDFQSSTFDISSCSNLVDLAVIASAERRNMLKSVADAAALWKNNDDLRTALETVRKLYVGIEHLLQLKRTLTVIDVRGYTLRDDGVDTATCCEMKSLIDLAVLDLELTSCDKHRRLLGLHSVIASSAHHTCPLHYRVFSILKCPTASWYEEEAAAVALFNMPAELIAQEYAEAAAFFFDRTQSSRKKVLVAWLLCKVDLFEIYTQQRTLSAEVARAGLQESDGGSLPYAQDVMKGDSADLEATANKLTNTSFLVRDLRAGFVSDLRNTGSPAANLIRVGFQLTDFREAGFTVSDLIKLGCGVHGFIKAGFQVADLGKAGITVNDLFEAGFAVNDLIAVGFRVNDLIEAGGAVSDLIKGYKAADFRKAGITVRDLIEAGWAESDLIKIGFRAFDFKDAGFRVRDLIEAGCAESDLIKIGFRAFDFKDAGFRVRDLIEAGCAESDLIKIGFGAADFRAAGFRVRDLIEAGCAVSDLMNFGFRVRDLIEAGITANDLIWLRLTLRLASSG